MEFSKEEILKTQEKNQKLYQFYKMVSWDLLFYYAISFLFLTQAKNFSTSEYVFAETFFPLFKIIVQIPCTLLVEKIGKKNALIIGNVFIFTYVLIVIGLNSVAQYIIANFFCAIGFVIKSITESNLLYDSIPNTDQKRAIFSKIDGRISSLYHYFSAITAVASGFLFVVNPYIPLTLCLGFTVLSVLLSCQFKEIPIQETSSTSSKIQNSAFAKQLQTYLNGLKQAFQFILKSNRLRALILFNAIFVSFYNIIGTLRRSVLTEIDVPNAYFGIIFAVYLSSSLTSLILGILFTITFLHENTCWFKARRILKFRHKIQ